MDVVHVFEKIGHVFENFGHVFENFGHIFEKNGQKAEPKSKIECFQECFAFASFLTKSKKKKKWADF